MEQSQFSISEKSRYAFAWILGGEAFSMVGTQVSLVILPLLAVSTLHATAFKMGLIGASGWLPILILGLVAGVIIDRVNTWKILVICNFSRFIFMGLISLASIKHFLSIPLLLIMVFIVGIAHVFFDIAWQTFIPEIVSAPYLARSNSAVELCRAIAQTSGPIIAEFLPCIMHRRRSY